MNKKDRSIYNNRYDKRLNLYGNDPRSLGWGGGKKRQFLRYKNLLEIGFKENDSILDVGCGFGDLHQYLSNSYKSFKYKGIDINKNLINVAKNQNKNIDVQQIDILETKITDQYDWVVSSGIFNAKLKFESNIDYISKMLFEMTLIANKGVAVDFMSTFVDYQHEDAYHMDPSELITIVKNQLKKKLILKMDYLDYEYCIYIINNTRT